METKAPIEDWPSISTIDTPTCSNLPKERPSRPYSLTSLKQNHIDLCAHSVNVKEFSFRKIYSLKLVSAIFYQIFVFHQMIALYKLWKMLFISSKKLFSFSRCSNFSIFVFPSFFHCQPLLERFIQEKSWSLWCHQLFK